MLGKIFWKRRAIRDKRPTIPAFAPWKQRVLDDFRAWLETLADDETAYTDDAGDLGIDRFPDLTAFYGELGALKQEVKLQARATQQVGRGIEQVADGFRKNFKEQSEKLNKTASDLRSQAGDVRREAQNEVLLEAISVRDAMVRALENMPADAASRWFWRKPSWQRVENGRRQLQLVYDKLDELLRRFQVFPVAQKGDLFHAETMRVVLTSENSGAAHGTVVAVVVQGYRRDKSLLKLAEVQVEK